MICPAYAGMILHLYFPITAEENLSRVCGDDPEHEETRYPTVEFVPRMRG